MRIDSRGTIYEECEVSREDTFELLFIGRTGIGFACAFLEDSIGCNQVLDDGVGDTNSQCGIVVVASRPSEFCQAGENDTLIVCEDDGAIVLAGGHGNAIVEEVSRWVHGGS